MGNEQYTRDRLITEFNKVEDIRFFYSKNFMTNRGFATDTKEYFPEIAAEWVIKNLEKFKQIAPNCRKSSYFSRSRDGHSDRPEAQSEKQLAIKMFNQEGGIPGVGVIVDYQTPLKNKRIDKFGEIDLLAYDADQKILRILELKIPDSKEPILKCVLEAYTYLKLVDRVKLIRDLNLARKGERERFPIIPEDTPIVACPFVFRYTSTGEDGFQYKEIQEDHPNLKKLMKLLEIKPLVIEENQSLYSAREL